jgi:hypothetical protein
MTTMVMMMQTFGVVADGVTDVSLLSDMNVDMWLISSSWVQLNVEVAESFERPMTTMTKTTRKRTVRDYR